jgi:DNA polymerase-1
MYKLGSQYSKQQALSASKTYKGSWITENLEDGTYEVWAENKPDDFWCYQDTLDVQNNPLEPVDIKTVVIESIEQLKELIAYLYSLDAATAWDTETTGIDWQFAELVGIGICWGLEQKQSAYIPVQHWKGNNLDLNEVIKIIKPFLEDSTQDKVFHNAKYDMHILANYGIQVKGVIFDTIVAHYLIRQDRRHALDIVIQDYVPCEVKKFETVIKLTKETLKQNYKTKDRPHLNKVNISHADIEIVANYCGFDVWSTLFMYEQLEKELTNLPDIEELFYSIEMPLIRLLFDMERKGLCLDDRWYERTTESLVEQRKRINQFGIDNYRINIQSPVQVRKVLLEQFNLDVDIFEKTATGEISVNAAKLRELKNAHKNNKSLLGFLNVVLTNRKIVKMGSTYVKGVWDKKSEITNRLHTSYNQTRTDTGRLSSSNPNSQNFPARGKYIKYRSGIVPEEGMLFVGADYSGCELRILAHMSSCKAFIDTFVYGLNGGDAHATTAKLIFGLDREPTKTERFMGKTINFGVIYGMQYQKLSRTLGITEEEAIKLFDLYWSNLPEIQQFVLESWKQAVCLGYTETLMGRRRYFDFVSDKLKWYKGRNWKTVDINFERIPSCDSDNLRASANHRIQGSNADITKKAMLEWNRKLDPNHGYLSLSIHDEIISSIKREMVEYYLPIKRETMENVVKLNVPLTVDIHIGENWRKLK